MYSEKTSACAAYKPKSTPCNSVAFEHKRDILKLMQDDFRTIGSAKPAPALKPTPTNINITEQLAPFETPDQVSEHDLAAAQPPIGEPVAPAPPSKGTGHHWFNPPWPPTKHEVLLILGVLIVAVVGVGAFIKLRPAEVIQPISVVKKVKTAPVVVKPTTVPSTLSGLPVAPEVNQRPVVGIMIENSAAARPQSGLSQAGVVFEAIAEGGITRFLALFQDQQPTNVGPIRSARPYYVQWNEGFRAAYVHVGGSPDGLAAIKTLNVQDINQFYNANPFHRDSSRPAPHNMYASVVDLAALATQKGYKSDYTGFARKTAKPVTPPTATSIDFNISSALYNPHYAYDAPSNSYLRSEGGAPQMDANTGKQLAPNVVVAMVVPMSAGGKTAQGGAYSNYNAIGAGTAYIFQDGVMVQGNWNKASATAQISFTDAAGAIIAINPGQTWISAVTDSAKVVYK